jgi:hypothetical protein
MRVFYEKRCIDAGFLLIKKFYHDKGTLFPCIHPFIHFFDNITSFDESINHILLSNLGSVAKNLAILQNQ